MVNPSGINPAFWRNRRVLVTGHTGFKGSWLALWLRDLGACVSGYALPPPTTPNLFQAAGIGDALNPADGCFDHRGDIGDIAKLGAALAASRPEIVLHLAAQPLVRESYARPHETWRVNVDGTLRLLEACHAHPGVKAIVVITTDKVYENPERGEPFREGDPLGGHDPYSSSKAACEILCASWRRSFLAGRAEGLRQGLATARAGNVIGGGDFAADRLIPDFVRTRLHRTGIDAPSSAASPPRRVLLRYPDAVRPWQHVLEPLAGYLMLAERLYTDSAGYGEGFNFGPLDSDVRSVRQVADAVCDALDARWEREMAAQPHEAGLLRLHIGHAVKKLGWRPRLRFETALKLTCDWYAAFLRGEDMRALTLQQIREYQALPFLPFPEPEL